MTSYLMCKRQLSILFKGWLVSLDFPRPILSLMRWKTSCSKLHKTVCKSVLSDLPAYRRMMLGLNLALCAWASASENTQAEMEKRHIVLRSLLKCPNLRAGWRWPSRCHSPLWRLCSLCRWYPPETWPASGRRWDRLLTCTPLGNLSGRSHCGSGWESKWGRKKQTKSQEGKGGQIGRDSNKNKQSKDTHNGIVYR